MKSRDQTGFSFLEALIGLTILVLVMALVMTFMIKIGATMQTESTALAMQQAGRLALDELARTTRQIGFGIARAEPFNSAVWQASTIHASSHTLAFNADIDDEIGNLQSSVTVSFPLGPSYIGESATASQIGAETYVYTLDANGNGSVTAADRTSAATGSYNPAADNDNPMDFAIFRRIYGYNGTDNGGELEPLAANLFTNATSDSIYPDSTTPDPLFIYWLTEDLNHDGTLDDVECVDDVVGTCPPSSARDPRLYLWGDTDFDGRLSETEKTALLTREVGSTAWSKNPLVDGGSYVSTTLTVVTDPTSADPYTLQVNDASKIAPGTHVVIGTGGSAERHYVDLVVRTTPELVVLSAPIANVHGVGTTVAALPSTLLRAIRSVGITFSAITAERDADGDRAAVGRAGRVGTRGLDYKVVPFRREVEVFNASTVALVQSSP